MGIARSIVKSTSRLMSHCCSIVRCISCWLRVTRQKPSKKSSSVNEPSQETGAWCVMKVYQSSLQPMPSASVLRRIFTSEKSFRDTDRVFLRFTIQYLSVLALYVKIKWTRHIHLVGDEYSCFTQ